MLTDVALSIGAIFGLSIILGYYCNTFTEKPTVSFADMLILASIGALVMMAFLAVFLLIGRIFG